MKALNLVIICSLFVAKAFSQCADSTKIYTFTFEGKKYEVVQELKKWDAAAACAVERGGYLVEINNAAEQKAVFNAIMNGAKVSPSYVSVSTGGDIAYVWTGASDKKTEGTWLWDGNKDGRGIFFWSGQGAKGSKNGKAIMNAYYNWGGSSKGTPNVPDNYGTVENSGALALSGWPSKTTNIGIAGEWNDLMGSTLLYYVIEYDKK